MKPLETQLSELQNELKSYFEKAAEEKKQYGTMLETTKTAVDALQKQLDAIDKQLQDKHQGGGDVDTLDTEFKENESLQRLMRDRSGKATIHLSAKSASNLFQRKTTITLGAVGTATTGVLPIGRLPEITAEPRQQLTFRDVLTARPTTFQVLDFVKVNAPMTIASPVAETSLKPENALTFTSASERVKTIATWIPASKQIMDDMPELLGFVKTMMPYYVDLAEELQLLSGDNTGENLHGVIPQATAFNTGLLHAVAGWNKIDMIGRVIQQITAAKELPPTFIVVHPNDWWDIRLTKDGFGHYILGDPQQGAMTNTGFGSTVPSQNLFGLRVVPTVNIAAGTFLVGSGSPIASEIRDRMEMQIDISTEHSDFFTRNLVAVRAEKRLALVVRRPASFITGSFVTSPVGQ